MGTFNDRIIFDNNVLSFPESRRQVSVQEKRELGCQIQRFLKRFPELDIILQARSLQDINTVTPRACRLHERPTDRFSFFRKGTLDVYQDMRITNSLALEQVEVLVDLDMCLMFEGSRNRCDAGCDKRKERESE